jgi:hypothetical protein
MRYQWKTQLSADSSQIRAYLDDTASRNIVAVTPWMSAAGAGNWSLAGGQSDSDILTEAASGYTLLTTPVNYNVAPADTPWINYLLLAGAAYMAWTFLKKSR